MSNYKLFCGATRWDQGARTKAKLTREERREVASRIFEALCAQYPDRYIALVDGEIAAASMPQLVVTEAGPVSQPLA